MGQQVHSEPVAAVTHLGSSYRLVPLVELLNTLTRLPSGCKATVVLDCGHSVVPGVAARSPAPVAFPRRPIPDLAQLPAAGNRNVAFASQPRYMDLPARPMLPTSVAAPGTVSCSCQCFSACEFEQCCAELPIEGAVQGAFT